MQRQLIVFPCLGLPEGKAYFVSEQNKGYLKVSFFGPFYGSNIVFELDKENYQHAFIAGPDTSYLWFLSRTPTVSKELFDEFVTRAGGLDLIPNILYW